MRRLQLKAIWTKFDKDGDLKGTWEDSKVFRSYLQILLEQRIKAAREGGERDAYDIQNWALKQADSNGAIRTYREIIGLLS